MTAPSAPVCEERASTRRHHLHPLVTSLSVYNYESRSQARESEGEKKTSSIGNLSTLTAFARCKPSFSFAPKPSLNIRLLGFRRRIGLGGVSVAQWSEHSLRVRCMSRCDLASPFTVPRLPGGTRSPGSRVSRGRRARPHGPVRSPLSQSITTNLARKLASPRGRRRLRVSEI